MYRALGLIPKSVKKGGKEIRKKDGRCPKGAREELRDRREDGLSWLLASRDVLTVIL